MLMTLKQMVGMPVICQDRQVGCVENVVPDAFGRRICGVVVRRGMGSAKWAPSAHVALIGRRCVLLDRMPQSMPEMQKECPARVFLSTGEYTGEVTDAVLRGGTLRLTALEVSAGPIDRLLGRRGYAADYRVAAEGMVVAKQLLSWAQLRCRLGEEERR